MEKDSKAAFGLEDWVVEPTFNRLVRGDVNHRVEPKVMSVLIELAAQSGKVVSKNEIIHAVWPSTYVGEDALTRCISVLRHLLGDDPRNPRFIQTVSKIGYCLLVHPAPLTLAKSDQSAPSPAPDGPAQDQAPMATNHSERAPLKKRRSFSGARIAMVALALSAALLLAFWYFPSIRSNPKPPSFQTFQLTTNAGEQSWPVLSPDGKRVAFVWAKGDGGRQRIYVKQMGSESLMRLTDIPGDEYSPAWSPDGTQIAFLSSSETGLGLYVASLGGTPSVRKVYIPGVTTRWEQGALSWSPDGRHFALVDHLGGQANSAIYLIDLATLHASALTAPPPGWEGDLCPVFSRDGEKIAFLRGTESWVMDLFWVATSGGQVHQVTHDGKSIDGMAWSSDDRSIVFSSIRAGQYALWSVPLAGGTPLRLPVGTEYATQPAISSNGNSLVFVEGSALFSILQVPALSDTAHAGGESPVVSSTAQDSAPTLSPDGTQFAFQSQRSGSQQIWISSLDGQSLRQLTPIDPNLSMSGSPAWSSGGGQILFDSRIGGHAHIFCHRGRGRKPATNHVRGCQRHRSPMVERRQEHLLPVQSRRPLAAVESSREGRRSATDNDR